MWWSVLLIGEAEAVPVCSACTYTTVQAALEVPYDEIELLDEIVADAFTVDAGRVVIVTADPAVGTRLAPVNAYEAMITVSGGATLTLSDVILEGRPSPSIVVDGATFTGTGLHFEAPSIGISATNGAVVSVATTDFEDGVAPHGSGILAEGAASVTVTGSTFDRMSVSGRGGAILVDGGDLAIDSSHFQACHAEDGGAVAVLGGALAVTSSTFVDNVASGSGGSLSLLDADLVVTASAFQGGTAELEGGAIHVRDAPGSAVIAGSDLAGASAERGGLLSVDGAPLIDVSDTRFADAEATFGDGGGASIARVDLLLVHAATFERTAAAGRGGAIHVEGTAAASVTGSTFCGAEALSGGDGPGRGGALSFADACDGAACIVESVLFGDPLADEASVVYVDDSVVTVRNATILQARALLGGGGLAVSDAGTLRLDGSVILDTGGIGLVARNGGSATTGQVVVDPGATAAWSGNDGSATEEVPIREERVELLVVPRDSPVVLPCGRESRIHPQSSLYQAFMGTDFGAYGGSGQVGAWQDDADGDLAPWVYDCDEEDPLVSGLLAEICDNTVDDDCDGLVDDDDGGLAWYADADGDGAFGADPVAYAGCDPAPGLRQEPGDDCDDGDAQNFPGNPELCNHQDEDCDGEADEDPVDPVTWVVDADGDGFGVEVVACDPPPDSAPDAAAGDCDDVDPTVHPEAVEVDGDALDQDCDGLDSEGFVAGGACGCDGAGGARLPLLAALAALSQRRRRASPSPASPSAKASGNGSITTSGRAHRS